MDLEILRLNIIKYCKIAKTTPTKAGIESGAGKDFVANLLKGRVPSVEKVALFAAHLGVTTSELLGEKIPPVSDLDTSGIDGSREEINDMLRALAAASPETQEIIGLLLRLNPENQSRALEYIRFELDRQEGAEGKR